MQIMNLISNITRGLNSRPGASGRKAAYCFPANGTAGYSSSIWVKDYGSGLYMRVPV